MAPTEGTPGTAVFNESGRFTGHEGRECGAHAPAVGRAWCPGCSQWCYPEQACHGCEAPSLRTGLSELQDRVRLLETERQSLTSQLAGLSAEVRDAKTETSRVRNAYARESLHVEQILAGALGYPRYGAVGQAEVGADPDEYVTGDSTAESLADQAARELATFRTAPGRRDRIASPYLRVRGESGDPCDGMVWPNPDDPHATQWQLRHGEPDRLDLLFAAAVLDAYGELFSLPQRTRNLRLQQVKEARDRQRGEYRPGDRVSAVDRWGHVRTGTFAIEDGYPVVDGCEVRPGSFIPAPEQAGDGDA